MEWGKYYALPLHWKKKEWLLFGDFILLVLAAVYLDEPIRYFFFTLHGPIQDAVFNFGHWYGRGFATLYLFLGFYLVGLTLNSEPTRLKGLMIGQAYLYSGLITISLKSIVGRWRPYVGHGHLVFTPFITAPNDYLSFPSGHTAVAFSLSTVMAGFSKNKIWKIFWFTIAAITGLSRIYHDDHWFSDVVFSTVNGIVVGFWLLKQYEIKHAAASDFRNS